MSYLVIEDFRFGLDKRKSAMSARAGSLVTLDNAHITAGGEIEKRKAFVDMLVTMNDLLTGLQPTANDIVVFGSSDQSAAVNGTYLGIPVRYLRCQHPNTAIPMLYVLWSEVFDNKVYAVCQFDDGSKFVFKENDAGTAGELVLDFTAGIVLSHMTTATVGNNSLIAEHFRSLINATGRYTAGAVAGNGFTVTGWGDSSYTVSPSVVTGSTGTVTGYASPSAQPVDGQSAVAAFAEFKISAGSAGAGNQITNIEVLNAAGGSPVAIIDTAITWTTSNANTAALVAAEINSFTHPGFPPEYEAGAVGNVVKIYAPTASGDAVNGYIVRVTTTGNVCVDFSKCSFGGNKPITVKVTMQKTSGAEVFDLQSAQLGASLGEAVGLVAAAINASTVFCACAIGNDLYFSRKVTRSDDELLSVSVETTDGTSTVNFEGGPVLSASLSTEHPVIAGSRAGQVGGETVYISSPVEAYASGGTAPYTYEWVKTSGDGNVWCVSPSNYRTTFETYGLNKFSNYICRVRDAKGLTGESKQLSIGWVA